MKKERDQACRNYEIRVNMLGSGQYQEDEVDPYYQEKFEFAVDHKFSSDEEESESESIDDYLDIDIRTMVNEFINQAMEEISWPKEVPDWVPRGLTFLRQPDESINSIQYCFMQIQ